VENFESKWAFGLVFYFKKFLFIQLKVIYF